ncbi:MAG: NAD(P)/FAD-dependent oxidoreductase, partial [Dehalococcoidales bacterium]|nr:NAD(P)/FAD-dependent oxidoreductase [Dehalococcoidales bacterium]
VVLEQQSGLGEPICCTGIVSQECVRSFTIGDEVILRRVNSARLFSPSGKQLQLRRQEVQACILDRPAFNLAIASLAQDGGAEYMLDSPVTSIAIRGGGVRLEVVRRGEKTNLDARVAVIASGFASHLTRGLGKINRFALGAQAEVATAGIDEVELYFGQQIAPGFFGWLVPTLPSRAWVGLLTERNPRAYLTRLISSLKAQGKITQVRAEPSYRGIPLKPLARTYGERLLVVGTAAGQIKPTTGGGIYYGLLCADIAASHLHRALSCNDLSAGRLAEYEREWKERIGRELRRGYRVRKIYQHLSDRQLDGIFKVIEDSSMADIWLKSSEVSFDWHGEPLLKLLGRSLVLHTIKAAVAPFHLRHWG